MHEFLDPNKGKRKAKNPKLYGPRTISSKEEQAILREVGFLRDPIPVRKATKEELEDPEMEPHIINTNDQIPTAKPKISDVLTAGVY